MTLASVLCEQLSGADTQTMSERKGKMSSNVLNMKVRGVLSALRIIKSMFHEMVLTVEVHEEG